MARAERIARKALGDAEFERLVEQGKHLRDSEIAALAFADQD